MVSDEARPPNAMAGVQMCRQRVRGAVRKTRSVLHQEEEAVHPPLIVARKQAVAGTFPRIGQPFQHPKANLLFPPVGPRVMTGVLPTTPTTVEDGEIRLAAAGTWLRVCSIVYICKSLVLNFALATSKNESKETGKYIQSCFETSV